MTQPTPETPLPLSRENRRAMEKALRRAKPAGRRRAKVSRLDLKMRDIPWNIHAVWSPIEQILDRIEIDGTVDSAQGKPVFYDAGQNQWFEVSPAIMGVVDFHEIAAARHGWIIDLTPLRKLAKKFEASSPIFEADLAAVRNTAAICKRCIGELTLREAQDILKTIRTQIEFSRLGICEEGGAT